MLHTRCDLALQACRLDFERTLAVLREENSTLRRMLEAEARRADGLLLELTRSAIQATAGAPIIPAVPSIPRKPTTRDPISGLGNVLDPVTFGDPEGLFESAAAASLMAAEDDDGPIAATA